MHLASEAGHTEVVQILLENGGNANAQDQMNGETPLHLACEAGFSDIVQLLLDHGADTTIENVYKKQALHYANAATQVFSIVFALAWFDLVCFSVGLGLDDPARAVVGDCRRRCSDRALSWGRRQ